MKRVLVLITMLFAAQITQAGHFDDGTQNLDVITFDAAKSTLAVEAYILK
jgi:hypothetical protein